MPLKRFADWIVEIVKRYEGSVGLRLLKMPSPLLSSSIGSSSAFSYFFMQLSSSIFSPLDLSSRLSRLSGWPSDASLW